MRPPARHLELLCTFEETEVEIYSPTSINSDVKLPLGGTSVPVSRGCTSFSSDGAAELHSSTHRDPGGTVASSQLMTSCGWTSWSLQMWKVDLCVIERPPSVMRNNRAHENCALTCGAGAGSVPSGRSAGFGMHGLA